MTLQNAETLHLPLTERAARWLAGAALSVERTTLVPYMVSIPGKVKYPTGEMDKICRGLNDSTEGRSGINNYSC